MAAASSALTVSTPSELEIVMTRSFEAPRQLVFDAWTKPEHLRHWIGQGDNQLKGWTMRVCEVDLRPGGAYHFVWDGPDAATLGIAGVYREIVPGERVVSTEIFDEPYRDEMGGEVVNTLVLEERDGRTTVTQMSLYSSKEARDGALQTGMESGVAEGYDTMERYLRTLA
jgi:uncharacterized protein YndB with AHSA1/START domain